MKELMITESNKKSGVCFPSHLSKLHITRHTA